jgi:hypothetical protein
VTKTRFLQSILLGRFFLHCHWNNSESMVPFLGALFVSGLEEPTRTHEKQLHVHWTSLHEVLMTANIVGFLSPLPSIQVQDKGAIRSNCGSCFFIFIQHTAQHCTRSWLALHCILSASGHSFWRDATPKGYRHSSQWTNTKFRRHILDHILWNFWLVASMQLKLPGKCRILWILNHWRLEATRSN